MIAYFGFAREFFIFYVIYYIIYQDSCWHEHFDFIQNLVSLTSLSERQAGNLWSSHLPLIIGAGRDEVEDFRGRRAVVGGGPLRMFRRSGTSGPRFSASTFLSEGAIVTRLGLGESYLEPSSRRAK